MAVNVGDLIQHYRIVALVGEGGMGVVYRASDTRLQRDVALKFLTAGPALTSAHRERLAREGQALAAINHPHILTIHDIGDAEGVPFLVLEWASGGSLAGRIRERPVATEEFLRLALPIADALTAAHHRGIVHRDLKPANVLLTGDDRIKLADFGLAKFFETDSAATRTAGTFGTVAYMSPEQAKGLKVGPASDIFSFGVLAYELLTGVRPFRGEAVGVIVGALLHGHYTPLSRLRSDLPGDLIAIVDRCLEPDPRHRFSSASELGLALREVRGTPGSVGDAATTSRVHTRPAASHSRPEIRYCSTGDGVSIAYAVSGAGPVVVRVLGYFTHLEMEWDWPDLHFFWDHLGDQCTVVRYDGRGIGLSDRYDGDFSEETRQLDLDAVLRAVGQPAALLGISEGGWSAATYAISHPERVTRVILYGAYCRGAQARPGYDREEDEAIITLIRKGWGRDTPAFRQVVTSQFFRADADPQLIAHFTELQRVSATPDTAARYQQSIHRRGDGRELFRQLKHPTLVIHGRDDLAVSADEGRLLASIIPGAQLVLMPSGTHYFPTDEQIAATAAEAIASFVGP